GMIERVAGSTRIRHGVDVIHAAPGVAILFALIAATVAAFPPGSGFVGKLLLLQSLMEPLGGLPVILILSFSFIVIAVLGRMWALSIWRGEDETPHAQPSVLHYIAC